MIRAAVASRELPLPTKYIVQPPKVDLLLALNVLTTPTPLYVALTCATLVVPVGTHPAVSQVNACSVMSIGERAGAREIFGVDVVAADRWRRQRGASEHGEGQSHGRDSGDRSFDDVRRRAMDAHRFPPADWRL